MNDRTIMQMEVHPKILQARAFRNTLRKMLGALQNESNIWRNELHKKWLSDCEFAVGTVLQVKIPKRFVVNECRNS